MKARYMLRQFCPSVCLSVTLVVKKTERLNIVYNFRIAYISYTERDGEMQKYRPSTVLLSIRT